MELLRRLTLADRDQSCRPCFGAVLLFAFVVPWSNVVLIPYIGTLGRATGLVLFTVSLYGFARGARPRIAGMHWILLAFVLWAAASLLWSPVPEVSRARIFTYVQLWLMTWLVYQWTLDRERLDSLLAALAAGAVVGAAALYLNFLQGFEYSTGRYSPSNFNPNDIAYLLALAIPLAWNVFLSRTDALRWLFALYPPWAVAAILLTGSRSGLLIAALGLLYPVVRIRDLPPLGRYLMAAMLLALVAAVATVSDSFLQRLQNWNKLTSGNYVRAQILRAGAEAVPQAPLVGSGAGMFDHAARPLIESNDPQLASQLSEILEGEFVSAHSAYLEVLVENGAVGIGLLVGVLAAAAWRIRRVATPIRWLWAILLLQVALVFLVKSWHWYKPPWLAFALIAIATAPSTGLARCLATSGRGTRS